MSEEIPEDVKLLATLMGAQSAATASAVNACWEHSERQYRRTLAKYHIITERIMRLATDRVLYNPHEYLVALTVREHEIEEWLVDHYDGDWRDPVSTQKPIF